MKTVILAFLIFTIPLLRAQMSTISTYGSGYGLGPTTTITPTGNGYTYSSVGGLSGGSWGGVTASPGTGVQAAVTPAGAVIPIVTPVSRIAAPEIDPAVAAAQIAAAQAQQMAAIDQQFAANLQILNSLPAPSGERPIRVERAIPVVTSAPTPATYEEFNKLFAQLPSEEKRLQFWRDIEADYNQGPRPRYPVAMALPYLKLWLREHQGISVASATR